MTAEGGENVSSETCAVVLIGHCPIRAFENATEAHDWAEQEDFTEVQRDSLHIWNDVPYVEVNR